MIHLIGTFCIVNLGIVDADLYVNGYLIGTFCIVNLLLRHLILYYLFHLIGTFCIVNYDYMWDMYYDEFI